MSGRTVAVVGGGIAGLACARALVAGGFDVAVFDKGRSAGGRMATRRAGPDLAFDHGAQYFTARDPRFREATAGWVARGAAAEWPGRVVRLEGGAATDTTPQPRYVGVPGMSAVAADLAAGLCVQTETHVVGVARDASGWTLTAEGGDSAGPFDALVVTLPSPQAAELLHPHPFAAEARAVRMAPCWAAMAAFEGRLGVPWDGAFVHGSPLSWAARDGAKPGRPRGFDCWVLHGSPEWSAEHLEAAPEGVAPRLLEAFAAAVGRPLPPHRHLAAHRWRYSQGSDPADQRALWDPDARLAVCGDWLAGGRVEGAFLAGVRAAEFVTGQAALDAEPSRRISD